MNTVTRDDRKTLWYESGLRFECSRCGDCCRGKSGFVWVRESDIFRITEHLGLSRRDFMERYAYREGMRISLREKPGGDCIFWEDTCLIYPVRPPQCRSFPFWRDYLATPTAWSWAQERCGGIGSGRLHQVHGMGTESAFEELEDVYRAVARELAGVDVECRTCGSCCHLRRAGHELFATRLEVYYMVNRAGMPSGNAPDGVCPYLDGAACSAHPHRTLGCRVFFCDEGVKDFHRALYERYRSKIGMISSDYYLPTDYGRLTDILAELGP